MRTTIAIAAGLIGQALLTAGCSRLARDVRAIGMTPVEAAISAEPAIAQRARQRLRSEGQVGLDRLLAAHAARVAACMTRIDGDSQDEPADVAACDQDAWPRLRDAIDAVAGQRDAAASRLFWHDDFERARAEATSTGKPIVSLRLLGRLDEELTCANSRYFRSVLYPNDRVSQALRDGFVLHWKTVRPVPKLTVDFGDGRRLETTLTGNSIHYMLTPDGEPVDAIPGLNGSEMFLRWLGVAGELARDAAGVRGQARASLLADHHARRLDELRAQLARGLEEIRSQGHVPTRLDGTLEGPTADFDDDLVFSTGSFVSWPEGTKTAGGEGRVMSSILPDVKPLDQVLSGATWSALAQLHEDECRLDEASRRLILFKHGGGNMAPLYRALERSVAEDTVRNEHVYHRRIHRWFAEGAVAGDVDTLNARVYGELFGSAVSDAWLGLVPPDSYRALDGEGKRL
jgi:hypothetical protein